MSGARFVLPYQAVFAPAFGIPGAQLFFYESGTSTPLNTYSDANLTVANANPVVADAGGRFGNIFMLQEAYKVVLTDFLGDEIWTADPVYGAGGPSGNIIEGLREVTGNTTVNSSDGTIEVDATTGPVTVTYPIGLGTSGQIQPVTIVKIDLSTNIVSIIDDSSATIRWALVTPANGAAMASAVVYSNGTGLRVLA